jgi:hypothetical protein
MNTKHLKEALDLIKTLRKETETISVATDKKLERVEYLIQEVIDLLTYY